MSKKLCLWLLNVYFVFRRRGKGGGWREKLKMREFDHKIFFKKSISRTNFFDFSLLQKEVWCKFPTNWLLHHSRYKWKDRPVTELHLVLVLHFSEKSLFGAIFHVSGHHHRGKRERGCNTRHLVLVLHCLVFSHQFTLGGDKASMSTHTCPLWFPRKINWPPAVTRLTAHYAHQCYSWPDIWFVICKHWKDEHVLQYPSYDRLAHLTTLKHSRCITGYQHWPYRVVFAKTWLILKT